MTYDFEKMDEEQLILNRLTEELCKNLGIDSRKYAAIIVKDLGYTNPIGESGYSASALNSLRNKKSFKVPSRFKYYIYLEFVVKNREKLKVPFGATVAQRIKLLAVRDSKQIGTLIRTQKERANYKRWAKYHILNHLKEKF